MTGNKILTAWDEAAVRISTIYGNQANPTIPDTKCSIRSTSTPNMGMLNTQI